MARVYQTRNWETQHSPSLPELQLMAMEAYANLHQ
ncbi:unnamed protein product, partial [Laminaria digitata]